jgi:hypothetical protein
VTAGSAPEKGKSRLARLSKCPQLRQQLARAEASGGGALVRKKRRDLHYPEAEGTEWEEQGFGCLLESGE